MNSRMDRRTFLKTLSAVTGVTVFSAACGPTSTPAATASTATSAGAPSIDPYADILAKAKQEGVVSAYLGIGDAVTTQTAAAFTKLTGIKVDLLQIGADAQLTRVLQEYDAGLFQADVVQNANGGHFIIYKQKGMLEPYKSVEFAKILPGYADPDGYWYAQYTSRYCMVYNTKLVSKAQAPTAWKDLADPKWQGKLVIGHPAAAAGVAVILYKVSKIYGWGLIQDIAKNNPLVLQSLNDIYPNLAAGERQVGITGEYAAIVVQRDTQKLPIEAAFASEDIPASKSGIAIMKKAPHPNAAKVFLDYSLSKDGMSLINQVTGRDVVRADVPSAPGMIPLSSQKLDPVDYEDYATQLTTVQMKFKEIFGV